MRAPRRASRACGCGPATPTVGPTPVRRKDRNRTAQRGEAKVTSLLRPFRRLCITLDPLLLDGSHDHPGPKGSLPLGIGKFSRYPALQRTWTRV